MADGGEGSDPPNEPDPEPTLVQDPKRLADTIAVAQAAQQIFDSQDRDEKEPVVDVKEEVESEQNLPVRLGEPCRVSTSSQARRSSQIDGHHANEHFPREEAINGADKDGIIGRSGTSSTVTKADSSEHPAMSPRLLGHTIDGEPEQKLPAMQTSHPEGPSSPAAERLPGFKIMKDIAETTEKEQLEAARLNNIRQRRGHSFSSIAGSPPQLNNHYSSNGSHRSPSSQFPPLNTSSFGTHSSPHLGAHSPLSGSNPYYAARRQSQASDAYPPALTSASTTESYSSIDSTSPLGPTEHHISIDGNAIILPPPSGSLAGISLIPPHGPPSGFPCDYPGCTAPPFQTQYLLNSHANVHSQNRPHYCPMRGCPRSEGGKGFKRKNEMIRHGLVHDSPGYICPFCPDREHRYPRPDNLQRRVSPHDDQLDISLIHLPDTFAYTTSIKTRTTRRFATSSHSDRKAAAAAVDGGDEVINSNAKPGTLAHALHVFSCLLQLDRRIPPRDGVLSVNIPISSFSEIELVCL